MEIKRGNRTYMKSRKITEIIGNHGNNRNHREITGSNRNHRNHEKSWKSPKIMEIIGNHRKSKKSWEIKEITESWEITRNHGNHRKS